jgi:predicted DNA-binding transcriptional regulator AlpA
MPQRLPRGEVLLRAPEIAARLGCSVDWLYKLIRAERFPQGRKLGYNWTVWPESVVDEWIAESLRNAPPGGVPKGPAQNPDRPPKRGRPAATAITTP